jgi:hypothetical protein
MDVVRMDNRIHESITFNDVGQIRLSEKENPEYFNQTNKTYHKNYNYLVKHCFLGANESRLIRDVEKGRDEALRKGDGGVPVIMSDGATKR